MTDARSRTPGEPCSLPKQSPGVVQAAAIREHEQAIRAALSIGDGTAAMQGLDAGEMFDAAYRAVAALVAVVVAAGPPKDDLGGVRDASESSEGEARELLRETMDCLIEHACKLPLRKRDHGPVLYKVTALLGDYVPFGRLGSSVETGRTDEDPGRGRAASEDGTGQETQT